MCQKAMEFRNLACNPQLNLLRKADTRSRFQGTLANTRSQLLDPRVDKGPLFYGPRIKNKAIVNRADRNLKCHFAWTKKLKTRPYVE